VEIWLDTVNEEMIQKALKAGLLYGITTNPHVLAKSVFSPKKALQRLLALQPGPVTFQVQAASAEEMLNQGLDYATLSPRLIIKVPVTSEGYQTIKRLSDQGIPTMATVIFHAYEAIFASTAGACYLAPYFSRMRSNGIDASSEVAQMCAFTRESGRKSKVLVASLKEPEDFKMAVATKPAAITLNEDLFQKLFSTSSHTATALEKFLSV